MGARAGKFFPNPLESEIQGAVLDHWRLLGRSNTLVAAIPNQFAHGQPGLTPGLNDLLVMGPDIPGDHPIAFMELKRDHKREISGAQLKFALLCARLGLMCATARGRDEPIALLERWGVVRPANVPAHLERLLDAR